MSHQRLTETLPQPIRLQIQKGIREHPGFILFRLVEVHPDIAKIALEFSQHLRHSVALAASPELHFLRAVGAQH